MNDEAQSVAQFQEFFKSFKSGYPLWYPSVTDVNEYFRRLLPYDFDVVQYAFDKAARQSRKLIDSVTSVPIPPPVELVREVAEALQRDKIERQRQDLKRKALPPRAEPAPPEPHTETGIEIEQMILKFGEKAGGRATPEVWDTLRTILGNAVTVPVDRKRYGGKG